MLVPTHYVTVIRRGQIVLLLPLPPKHEAQYLTGFLGTKETMCLTWALYQYFFLYISQSAKQHLLSGPPTNRLHWKFPSNCGTFPTFRDPLV